MKPEKLIDLARHCQDEAVRRWHERHEADALRLRNRAEELRRLAARRISNNSFEVKAA